MRQLTDLLDQIDCIELDLHTHNDDPEETDFGFLVLETSQPLDIMVGETLYFKKVEFVLDDIEDIKQFSRVNKGKLNHYYRYRFDVAAEEKRRNAHKIIA